MGLLAFFATIVAVNIAFAIVAVRSFPGEDVRRSYLQGLAYNDTLAQRREQAQLGWRAVASFARAPDGAAAVQVDLRTREGAPIEDATLTGELRRAATARFDRELVFRSLGEGRYEARLSELPTGRWILRASAAEDSHRTLDFEAELTWP
jgi:nitrogen fixation protein FixH